MPRRNRPKRKGTPRVRDVGTGAASPRVPASRTKRPTPEELLNAGLTVAGYGPPHAQYRFHPRRRWRFDFCWPTLRLAVEVEGGIFRRGRHVRPAGFIADCEKYNAAALDGWCVIRVPVAGKSWVEGAVKLIVGAIEERLK